MNHVYWLIPVPKMNKSVSQKKIIKSVHVPIHQSRPSGLAWQRRWCVESGDVNKNVKESKSKIANWSKFLGSTAAATVATVVSTKATPSSQNSSSWPRHFRLCRPSHGVVPVDRLRVKRGSVPRPLAPVWRYLRVFGLLRIEILITDRHHHDRW